MTVVLSTGIGRLHLVQSAEWIDKAGVKIKLIQGWVPRQSAMLLNILGKLIGHKGLAYGMQKRVPVGFKGEIVSCALSEFLHQGLVRLARVGISNHWSMAARSWRCFGWQSSTYLKDAEIFHVRSGAGQGGAIKKAKQRGMKVVVDHSAVHPQTSKDNLQEDYSKFGLTLGITPGNPFWHQVLLDCKEADVLMVNSDFVKETFCAAGFPVAKINVVYLGVRSDFGSIKKEYNCRTCKGSVRLLFTGGFSVLKGAEYLLDTLRILNDRNINILLTVVGSYADAKPVLKQFNFLKDKVNLVGHVPQDDLKKYLSDSDIYVFPSLGEGCASSGMEALAAGLPVVATRESGLPIIDGETGCVVPAKDSTALADKIEWLIKNPAEQERLGRAAAAMISENYTWQKYAENVKTIYNEMLISKA